jgi:predicted glycogen debranching enzyme
MDAIVDGVPVTPRRGKAVDLNALWVNGLTAVGDLRQRVGADRTEVDHLRARAIAAFGSTFGGARAWLYDTVDSPDRPEAGAAWDPSLRPNQLLAFGLPHAPLRDDPRGPSVVGAVGRALLTPLGPRSLAPGQPGYRGHHRGGVWARDHAYHQGTVWPWLIGPYVDAARAVGLPTTGVCDGLYAHLAAAGVGSVSETADGDAPHRPTGCPFQAWSVAELLRVSTEST